MFEINITNTNNIAYTINITKTNITNNKHFDFATKIET